MVSISGKTSLVGLIGQPVDHSLSPVIHNAALKEMGLDWCYLAMPCPSENLQEVITSLRNLNCQGLNITIPYKQDVITYCRDTSRLAKRLGAVNTLVPNYEGGWTGENTDVAGFLAPLKSIKWTGRKSIILGCGGSARAVVAGLKELNIKEIVVIGRKETSLNKFLKDIASKNSNVNQSSIALKGFLEQDSEVITQIKEADIIINTTPVGMNVKNRSTLPSQQVPLDETIWKHLNSNMTLYDLIYTPRPTNWLKQGGKSGCHLIDGLEMLIQQGAASLQEWSGYDQIPINVMRKAAEKHLKT